MNRFIYVAIPLLLLTSTATPTRAQDDNLTVPRFESTPCPASLADKDNFECGYLIVPEDHHQPDGATIRLMVAVAHTQSAAPAPDPVLILVGGPGSSAVGGDASSLVEQAILSNRDIIYLDQRGTGLSEPNLACPELAYSLFDLLSEQQLLERVDICRARLIEGGVNLSAYTSAQSAADIAALRAALGYKEWNLWGTSYGTRLALTVMRDHPEGIRSVVLDSVYPPDVDPYLEAPATADQVFNLFFDQCEADSLCNFFYPELKDTFHQLYERLNRNPVTVTVEHPETHQDVSIVLTGDNLVVGLTMLLSDRGMLAYLPAIIHAFNDGDFSRLEGLLPGVDDGGIRSGMALSVMCSEEIAFLDRTELAAAAENYPAYARATNTLTNTTVVEICDHWLHIVPDPIENQPVTSDIPTLLLAGEYDTSTPPRWAEHAALTLSHHYVYTLPGVGHIALLGSACPARIMLSFLDHPENAPDAACVEEMPDIAFVVTAEATRPWAQVSATALGFLAIWFIGSTGWAAAKNPRQFAWKNSLRLMGWLPAVLSVGGLATSLALGGLSEQNILRLIEIVISLSIALQIVFLFSLDNEPPLEVLLTCPRLLRWALLERWITVCVIQGTIALTGTAIILVITGDNHILLAVIRWIPPTLMLSGIAMVTTIRSRMAVFGAAITLLVWFMMVALGDQLLPERLAIYPINYLQPWLWPFLPYLKPDSMSDMDYVLNRVVVAATGVCLIAFAVRQLRDEEMVLLGQRRKAR